LDAVDHALKAPNDMVSLVFNLASSAWFDKAESPGEAQEI
jgi:hypothetical protein